VAILIVYLLCYSYIHNVLSVCSIPASCITHMCLVSLWAVSHGVSFKCKILQIKNNIKLVSRKYLKVSGCYRMKCVYNIYINPYTGGSKSPAATQSSVVDSRELHIGIFHILYIYTIAHSDMNLKKTKLNYRNIFGSWNEPKRITE